MSQSLVWGIQKESLFELTVILGGSIHIHMLTSDHQFTLSAIFGACDELYLGDLYDWQVGMLVCTDAFVQAGPDCISHTWRLPWAYQPVISWLKSTMSHSVNIHSWWRHAHLLWDLTKLLLISGVVICQQNVAQNIHRILISCHFESFMLVTERDFKAKKNDVFGEISVRLIAAVNHSVVSLQTVFQRWWSTILLAYVTVRQECGLSLLSRSYSVSLSM